MAPHSVHQQSVGGGAGGLNLAVTVVEGETDSQKLKRTVTLKTLAVSGSRWKDCRSVGGQEGNQVEREAAASWSLILVEGPGWRRTKLAQTPVYGLESGHEPVWAPAPSRS